MKKISRREFNVLMCTAAGALAAPPIAGAAKPKVVVIGGGAGGATAARYIAKDSKGAIDVTLVEASKSFGDQLAWSDSVGPLAGKTILAVAGFLAARALLYAMWKDSDPAPGRIFVITWVLLAVGLLLTFPIFFQLFAPE